MSDIFQVVYISQTKGPISEDEVQGILEHARGSNARLDITGLLLFKSGHFLQILEGQEDRVLNLLGKISVDSRHENLKVLYEGLGTVRFFSKWSMRYRNVSEFDLYLRDRIEDLVGHISRGETLYDPNDVLLLFEKMR